jgi:hypothetical protein
VQETPLSHETLESKGEEETTHDDGQNPEEFHGRIQINNTRALKNC